MNTVQTNFLYNLIFSDTAYEEDGHFLGNKVFIRKNNKLAQIEFLKGNKIGEHKDLRDITIKVKLKSTSANEEEMEACMSFYDETHKDFLADFNELNFVDCPENLDPFSDIFHFVGNEDDLDHYAELYLDYNEKFCERSTLTFKNKKIECTLLWFFHEIGKDITAFLDFMFN